jgi:hypothetical protein
MSLTPGVIGGDKNDAETVTLIILTDQRGVLTNWMSNLIVNHPRKGPRIQWHLLKPKSWPVFSKTLMHQESDYGRMTRERFPECLGGYAACGLLRKILPESFDLSLPKQISWECA